MVVYYIKIIAMILLKSSIASLEITFNSLILKLFKSTSWCGVYSMNSYIVISNKRTFTDMLLYKRTRHLVYKLSMEIIKRI